MSTVELWQRWRTYGTRAHVGERTILHGTHHTLEIKEICVFFRSINSLKSQFNTSSTFYCEHILHTIH